MEIRSTVNLFKLFAKPLWIEFFLSVSNWKTSTPNKLKTEVLDSVYDGTMPKVFYEIRIAGDGTITIDGTTEHLGK